MNTYYKIVTIFCAAAFMTGCVSMDGRMVNAHGEKVDCSTSGGGIGLGMVVGAAAAAISNEACESEAESKGYLLYEDVGYSGIIFDKSKSDVITVKAAQEPASPCIRSGDIIKSINDKEVLNIREAEQEIFKKYGTLLDFSIDRDAAKFDCVISLAEPKSTQ